MKYTDVCVVARIVQIFSQYSEVVADLAESPRDLGLSLQRAKEYGCINNENALLGCRVR